jgi:hypothetical protein
LAKECTCRGFGTQLPNNVIATDRALQLPRPCVCDIQKAPPANDTIDRAVEVDPLVKIYPSVAILVKLKTEDGHSQRIIGTCGSGKLRSINISQGVSREM